MFDDWKRGEFIRQNKHNEGQINTHINGSTLPGNDSPLLGCDCADFLFFGIYSGDISPPLSVGSIPGLAAACGSHRCEHTNQNYLRCHHVPGEAYATINSLILIKIELDNVF